jgi:KUP system potassium uptake protein
VLILVLGFRSSSALASAYGIAVTGTMVVTSLLAFTVLRRAWGWPLPAVLAVLVPLLATEIVFSAPTSPSCTTAATCRSSSPGSSAC